MSPINRDEGNDAAARAPIAPHEAMAFLLAASGFFQKQAARSGEDKAFWAGVTNSENCMRVSALIAELATPADRARAAASPHTSAAAED